MNTRYLLSLPLLFALTASCSLERLSAQAVSGDLTGNVNDASGALVPGVSVAVLNGDTGSLTTTQSNGAGQYRFANLPVGKYQLSATHDGFAPVSLENIEIELNKVSTMNIVLQVRGVVESVTVSESAENLDTTTPQIQQTFDSEAILNVPMANTGMGVLNLSLLASGVASNGGSGVGVGPSVGGQRPRNNNFTVEGVDNNDKTNTGPKVMVPTDAVAEFTLLKNQFSPEYGHSSGGQFNMIVRSGSNDFHGGLYEYFQNRDLNALDVAFKQQGLSSRPRYDSNNLGGNFGGPIQKNRWFYFADFEYNPTGQASTPGGDVMAPTAAGYSLLKTMPGVSATNLGVFQKYVPASASATTSIDVNGVAVPFGSLSIVAPNFNNAYRGVFSTDYDFSDNDRLRGRFVYNRNTAIDTTGVSLPEFFLQNTATNYLASLAEYHTFSASLLNEFRLGYNRQNQLYGAGNFQFPGLDSFPNLTFDDLGLQVGPDPQAPEGSVQNTYQAADNVTWIHGAHTFSFGSDFRKYIAPSIFTQHSRGDYEYSSVALYLTDITPDVDANRGLGNVKFYGDDIATYSYAQDSWRIRPNVTLNFGLRYEYTTTPYTTRLQTLNAAASVPGVLEFGEPSPQKNAFAPRLGFAWSPGKDGKTAIRAGFGIAYDVLCDNLNILAMPPELGSAVDVTGMGLPGFLGGGGISPNMPGGANPTPDEARAETAYYIPNQTELPYSIQWNFSFQRVFGRNYTFEARYLGTRGVHLPMQQQINRTPEATNGNSIPEYVTAPDAATLASLPLTVGDIRKQSNLLPNFAAAGFLNPITAWTPQGSSTYNGMSLELNRHFSNGLQLLSSYTWSHLLDNSTSEVGSTYLTPRRAQDSQNLAQEWASSMLDRRQRFTAMVVYESKWLRHGNWFTRNILGNWEFAPTYVYESPEYFTVQSGIDSNLNGDSASDRAWVSAAGAAHTASDVYGLDRGGKVIGISAPQAQLNQVVAWVAVNPNARYVRAGYGVIPTNGRNTEPTRPINNVDLSVVKRLPLTEKMRLELAAQAFNLFNHAQFVPGFVDSVNSVVTAYTPAVHSFVTAGNPAFGDPTQAFSSDPRAVQIVAKLVW